jgi:hypothetical protein
MMVARASERGYNGRMRFGVIRLSLLVAVTCGSPGCDRDDSGGDAPVAKPAGDLPVSIAPVAEPGSSDADVAEPEPAEPTAIHAAGEDPSQLGATGSLSADALAGKPPVAPKPDEPAGVGSRPVRPATQESSLPPFRPLEDAKVGEWAVYQGLDSQRMRYEVREVGLSRVKTEVTVTFDGRPLGMPAIREDLRTAEPLAWETPADGRRQTSRTTIRAAGRVWDAILYEDQWTDEGIRYVRRTWVGGEAPIFGVIRMELMGDETVEARMELVEMGVGR